MKNRNLGVLFVLALCVCFPPSFLRAQTPDTINLTGQVFDQTQAAVPGVEIIIRSNKTAVERKTQTDSSGRFVLSGLPSGSYEITSQKSGFQDGKLENIELIGGSNANFRLQLNAATQKTEITVTGVGGEVRTDEPQVGDWLNPKQIQDMPLLNRRITYLPLLNSANRPAISQGDIFVNQNLFTTNGTGRRQAWFEVDGANSSDAWGRQTIFTNIQLDAVDEMTVLSNPFSAEYGRSAGSVVNIVTRTGTNDYHGSLFALWRPRELGATLSGFTFDTATSGNQILSDELTQAAATFSGPLFGDKTHFFLSGEYSWQNRASPVTSPLALGTFTGHYRGWLGDARIDHEINDKNNLFFRASADSFFDTNPNGAVGGNNLPTVARTFKRRTYTATLGETAVLSPTLLNNFRGQFQLGSPITQFDPVIFSTQYIVPTTEGRFTSGTSQSALLLNHQYEFNDTLAWVHGRHTLKFGGDVIHAHNGGDSKEFGGPIFLGSFTYNTCVASVAFCESPAYIGDINNVASYTQSYGNGTYTVDDTLWSLFAQDDFKLRPDLTVNLGLRYERQTFTDANKNFSPRVGFVYNLHGDQKTVLRGSFGLYYSQIVDNAAANYALTGPTGVFNYTATPGQVGFPSTVADAPLPAFPAGAQAPLRTLYIRPGDAAFYNQFFPTSVLKGYPDALLNPYTEQWTVGFERQLGSDWVLSLDYVGSHTIKINRPLDLDSPAPTRVGNSIVDPKLANCSRPFWVYWYNQNGAVCDASNTNPPPYAVITTDVNNGAAYYNALDVNLNHRFSRRFSVLASYTWSHALDTVDPDVPGQNPNNPNFTGKNVELGNAIFDQRHRFVVSGVYVFPLKISFGGVATFASGLPFNVTTGSNNSGDPGATTDRPVVNGALLGRNIGRGNAIYDVSPFIERPFSLGTERVQLLLRAESFNVFNHRNVVNYNGLWGNGNTPQEGFGDELTGITAQLPARSFQFSAKLSF
ncbi:MAG TPA: TonB-dependent receptor [Terriglobales bacterium]